MSRRRVHHRLDIYDVDLYLVTDVKAYDLLCRDLNAEEDSWTPWHSAGQVQTFHQGDGSDGVPEFHVVVCLDARVLFHETTTPGGVIKLCAHEATHASGLILDQSAQPYDGASEALAYLVGWITEWLWTNLPHPTT